jgi:uncharacterized protein (DUF488 family)
MNREGNAMPPSVLTIGHSTHPLARFLALLAQHGIEVLADIRRFPGSRKFPQFDQDDLASALQQAGIEYHWLEALGCRRHRQQDESPNLGLENKGSAITLTTGRRDGLLRRKA